MSFRNMNKEEHRRICSLGGKSVPGYKRTFFTNRVLASEAGKKGGQSIPASKRSFSTDHDLAVEAARKGGRLRGSGNQG